MMRSPCGIKPQLCDSAERTEMSREEAMAEWRGIIDAKHLTRDGNLRIKKKTPHFHKSRSKSKKCWLLALKTVSKKKKKEGDSPVNMARRRGGEGEVGRGSAGSSSEEEGREARGSPSESSAGGRH